MPGAALLARAFAAVWRRTEKDVAEARVLVVVLEVELLAINELKSAKFTPKSSVCASCVVQ